MKINIYYLLILCTLVSCVHYPVHTPPAPLDPKFNQAQKYFEDSDWKSLKKIIKYLPGSGTSHGMTLFYKAVIQGLNDPKKALDILNKAMKKRMKTQKRHKNFTELIDTYEAIFTALVGSCLITEGPLQELYWPIWKDQKRSTTYWIKKALSHCEKERQNTIKFVHLDPKIQKSNQAKESINSDEQNQPPVVDEIQNTSRMFTLDQAQKQSVHTKITVLLVIEDQKQVRNLQRIHETIQWISDQKEAEGLSITLKIIEIQEESHIAIKLEEISPQTQALILFSYSKKLQTKILAHSKVQTIPTLTISPYAIKKRSSAPLWKLFLSRSMIAKSLIVEAQTNKSKKIGLILPPAKAGQKIMKSIKRFAKKHEIDLVGSVQIQGTETSKEWESITKEMINWSADTLLFAVDRLSINILVTYLANQDYWSAPPSLYSKDLSLKHSKEDSKTSKKTTKNKQKQSKKYFKYLLWPNAYQDRLLTQSGRYLEGARLVSPVFKESESFQNLTQELQKSIARPADSLDPFFIDSIEILDQALRAHLILKVSLDELLSEKDITSRYLPKLSFKRLNIMKHLHRIEIKDRSFSLVQDPPKP
jgi:hypothetical protein